MDFLSLHVMTICLVFTASYSPFVADYIFSLRDVWHVDARGPVLNTCLCFMPSHGGCTRFGVHVLSWLYIGSSFLLVFHRLLLHARWLGFLRVEAAVLVLVLGSLPVVGVMSASCMAVAALFSLLWWRPAGWRRRFWFLLVVALVIGVFLADVAMLVVWRAPTGQIGMILCRLLRLLVVVIRLAGVMVAVLLLLLFLSMEMLLGETWASPSSLLLVVLRLLLLLRRLCFHRCLIPMRVPVDVRLDWGSVLLRLVLLSRWRLIHLVLLSVRSLLPFSRPFLCRLLV